MDITPGNKCFGSLLTFAENQKIKVKMNLKPEEIKIKSSVE
jgi:hypothetical protein